MSWATKMENVIGYKETKLGLIPEDWEVVKLEELGEILSGLTYSPNDVVGKEGTLVLRSSNVQNKRIELLDNVYVNVKDGKYNPVKKNDILICVRNGSKSLIGKNTIIPEKIEGVAFGAFMSIFRSDFNEFLFHIFDTELYRKSIYRNLGATINSINSKDLKRLLIPLPPLLEQKAIVDILSTWDKGINTTKQLIEALQQRKKGLLQQLLSGNKRLPGFTEEWEKKRIGEIAASYSVKNKEDKAIEVLSCTKYDGLVRSLDYFGRKIYADDLSKYKIVPKGYFAYATNHIEEGSIGYQDFLTAGLVSPMYTVFKTDTALVDDSYMFKLLKTDRMIYMYQSNMSGSIARRGGLRWNVFEALSIMLPPLAEQQAIANILTKVDEEIESYQAYLQSLQTQKKGLMQQLLTGAKRVAF